jgi:hypothetical protein
VFCASYCQSCLGEAQSVFFISYLFYLFSSNRPRSLCFCLETNRHRQMWKRILCIGKLFSTINILLYTSCRQIFDGIHQCRLKGLVLKCSKKSLVCTNACVWCSRDFSLRDLFCVIFIRVIFLPACPSSACFLFACFFVCVLFLSRDRVCLIFIFVILLSACYLSACYLSACYLSACSLSSCSLSSCVLFCVFSFCVFSFCVIVIIAIVCSCIYHRPYQ